MLGLGNVGAGCLRLLADNRAAIEARLGATVEVRRVLVRDLHRARDVDVPPELLTTDAGAILRDPEIDVIVELIGGIEPARAYILDALAAGKHVVTANKAVLAERGAEIFAAADAAIIHIDIVPEAVPCSRPTPPVQVPSRLAET